jgi:arsenical pump membrane protein
LLIAGILSVAVSFGVERSRATSALERSWPPLALVAGLLAVGFLANEDGLFQWAGGRLARLPGKERTLLAASMLLVAVVTAIFNLDTSVVFLTPTLVHVARSRGADETPFVYGAVMMSNSASLLLPGSNLTNLLVLGHGSASGAGFAARMAPAFVASVLVTIAIVLVWHHRRAGASTESAPPASDFAIAEGAVGAVAVTIVILFMRSPALVVLGIGIGMLLVRRMRRWDCPRSS